ncbi:sulfotransferase 1B1-like [Oculina patagonica]
MTEFIKEQFEGPVIHGMPWIPGTTQEMIDTFPRLSARQNDIYINTYAKAGTTWTQEIVWQIIHNGKIDYRRLDVRMPWIDGMVHPFPSNPYHVTSPVMIERMFESFPSPRVFKTHLPYDLVPKPSDQATKPRYIYVMRNPKDTAVSYYHHYLSAPSTQNLTWDAFFELFIKGEVFYGSWFDHVLSGWKHKDDPNMLLLKYEEMKKDTPGTIQKIAKFIGKELSQEILEGIINQTSFNAMKKEENVNYTWLPGFKGEFIRKGQVGDWKNYFTEEQNKRLDFLYAEKMAGSGLEFEFDL